MQCLLFVFLVAVIVLTPFSVISLGTFVIDAKAQQTNSVRYWGLIVDGYDDVESFGRDANYMFHVLNVHYHFDGIKYLAVDTSFAGVDGQATISNVRNAIRCWLSNKSGSNDVVFIFFATHGEGYNSLNGQLTNDNCIEGRRGDPIDEAGDFWNATAQKWVGVDQGLDFQLDSNIYWSDDIKNDLATLTYGKLIFCCESCFSGGFIDELSAPNRIILTATNETYTANIWGYSRKFSSWAGPFIDALHGEFGSWSTSTNTFSETGIKIDADLDKDGSVSMWEAWNYSWWNDSARIDGKETPWLDANGSGLPTYTLGADVGAPYVDSSRVAADNVWLEKKPAGDINNDGTVNILDAIILSNAYGSSQGDRNWNRTADLNTDGTINILDAILLSMHFNQSTGSEATSTVSSSGQVQTVLGGAPSLIVDPGQINVFKGEVFNVNVSLTNVTDLQGWEFDLYWNNTVLNCTNAAVVTPQVWQGYTQDYGPGLQPNYNSTCAMFSKAEAANYPAPPFNGSMTIATLTFQAMRPGTTALTLTDTILGNSTAQPIDCTTSSASVNVYYGRYMRSDTQQVNGLSAYKLSIPQSASPASYTQSGSGMGAAFGIRAWVRHSNGVEQEISLDGQTGTPEAIVGGGTGAIRSNTVSVAQTALQSTDSLVIRVYVEIADGPWNLCAAFTTEQLQASTLNATTWTVYYYTSSIYNHWTDITTAKFYWGTTTYNSRIQNLQYS